MEPLTLMIVLALFAITGFGIYAASKDKIGKLGSALSSGVGALTGFISESVGGYSWVLTLAFTGHLPALIFVIGHLVLLAVLIYNTWRYKKAIM